MKHTTGKFIVDKYGAIKGEDGRTLLAFGLAIPMAIKPNDECSENTKLICEAFNVANEIGLTPRELLSQRDELVEVLNMMIDVCRGTYGKEFEEWIEYKTSETLLTKITTKP